MKNTLLVLTLILMISCWSCSSDQPQKGTSETPKKETVKAAEENKEEAPAVEPIPEEQISKAKEMLANVSTEDLAEIDAKAKFNMLCSACHGTNGKLKMAGAKDLTTSIASLEENIAQIYHGKGLMTPFKGIMSDAEIVAVAKYIETDLLE